MMNPELKSLLCDVEEYLAKEDGQHPRRYKRLDPRSLLLRAYELVQDQEDELRRRRVPRDNDDD